MCLLHTVHIIGIVSYVHINCCCLPSATSTASVALMSEHGKWSHAHTWLIRNQGWDSRLSKDMGANAQACKSMTRGPATDCGREDLPSFEPRGAAGPETHRGQSTGSEGHINNFPNLCDQSEFHYDAPRVSHAVTRSQRAFLRIRSGS